MKTILLQMGFVFAVNAQSSNTGKISSAALLSDLDMLRSSVVTLHPGFGRFEPRENFMHSLDSVRATIAKTDSIALLSFFRIVNPVLTNLRCGHTKFFPPMKGFPFYFFTDKLIPMIVRFDNSGGLLVTKSGYPEAVGKYIRQINGQDIDTVLRALRPQMFVDGYVQSSADAQIQQYFSAWYANFIQNSSDPFTVVLTDDTKNSITLQMTGIDYDAWQVLNQNSSYLTNHNHIAFPSDTVARLRIANFYSTRSDKHFRRFLDSSFVEIRSRPVRLLIIDVRGNEGGNDALGKDLYAFIARQDFRYYDRVEVKVRRKKDVPNRAHAYLPRFIGIARFFIDKDSEGRFRFKKHQNLGMHHPHHKAYAGDVAFLMDGLSFSVTSEFLAVARSENRGLFIGEESGGTYQGNSSGVFAIYKLPSSGLDLGIPLAGYYTVLKPGSASGRGVLPHVTSRPSRQDLLSGKDPIDTVLANSESRNRGR